MLENVCTSIKYQLSACRILILADGGPSSEGEAYKEFKRTVKNCGLEMIEFVGWHHQTLMLKHCFFPGCDVIKTPLVLVGGHDWGFRALPIDWKGITEALLDPAMPFSLVQIKQADFADWEKGHFGKSIVTHGVTLLETNWFQGPMHVARCDWYRKVVENFTKPAMLESDQMNDSLLTDGRMKEMAVYIPSGDPGRLYHLDGRNAKEFYLAPGMFISGDLP